ncbi:hypothetical protein PTTG_02256 [Puccinia triticina 1-1 BBBD Race 1]|uniref:MARVEL domain-containing protein n=2 Tax=Puccinia triticina TaxID=208348 RepID=A0A0C4ENB5_PUCT1|nr:uncharacterized protein PtA15_5A44 [Puccinia triticina]OAV92348.1 hypothetical protein PTTG_02256 [Puccinia triticina 1-1 BBBD Race 1]WAQ84474.1 hypothetical protein PtA15_5A44 [Puccinia triticina]WAR57816.1 hypothetical protein PtB15_5B46 [Puccinia triticina]
MTVAKIIHLAIFSLIIIGCIAEIVTSGILVGDFNKLQNPDLYSSLVTRTKYLLFCGLWTVLFSAIYVAGLSVAPGHLLFSVASHIVWLGVTIILFVSGAAALQTEINGQTLPHQQRLEILQGFAWADSILLGLAMLMVLAIGIGRRNGLTGNLLGEP